VRVSPLEGHRIWSGSYDEAPNPLVALDMRILSDRLGPLRGLRVVDVACGTGRWMSAAYAQGAQVSGIDFCREMLVAAAQKPGLSGGVALAQADRLPMADGSADLVLCSLAIGYFPSVTASIAEMARIARRGGRIVISDLHPDAFAAGWKRSFHVRGSLYEIEHEAWNRDRMNEAANRCALATVWQTDAHLGIPEREIFRRAGKDAAFEEASSHPALRFVCWKKP
jgi:ubiquinone/menaquinone biosynthesis C-methylase UbiE